MLQAIENSVDHLALAADRGRGAVLRQTMKVGLFRQIYATRRWRHLAWLLVATALNLPLALYFPLALLVSGPILYGMPHVVASIRYVGLALVSDGSGLDAYPCAARRAGRGTPLRGRRQVHCTRTPAGTAPAKPAENGAAFRRVTAGLLLACLLITALKLTLLTPSDADLALMALVLGPLGKFLFKLTWPQVVLCALALAAFASASSSSLLVVGGLLALAHNFVPYFYWMARAADRRERAVAAAALGVFTALHVLILCGGLDRVYMAASAPAALDAVFAQVAPLGLPPELWRRGAVVFGFGSALHYLMWLKVIPELHHARAVPACFAQSVKALKRDLGRHVAFGLCILSLLSLAIWLMYSMQEARVLYFTLTSFHGYLEIAGLFIIAARKLPTLRREGLRHG